MASLILHGLALVALLPLARHPISVALDDPGIEVVFTLPTDPVVEAPAPTPPAKTALTTALTTTPILPPRPAPPPARRVTAKAAPALAPTLAPTPSIATPTPEAPIVDPAWQDALIAWLARHQVYPDAARRRGEQGRVVVRFTVTPDGQVLNTAIVQSSGSSWLDEAAVAMMRSASLPSFPPSMRAEQMTISAPIKYALR